MSDRASHNAAAGADPRVSILIPNFNNGRESSIRGTDDLLGFLLQTLWDTLHDDPTPLEILAYDDGSTDDSLATLRAWAKRSWPNGSPFLHLTEAPHCGYLSRVANILCRQARGDILVRLDGDIGCLTPRWAQRLCEIFDRGPANLGVVGPKQLLPEGTIHAMGDFVLHPHGYIHVASGLDRHAVVEPVEVDHIMGCFYCCRKAMYDDVGGYDERFLRGQTEDLGLMALLRGWRALAVPDIEFIHFHTFRKNRDTEADSAGGVRKTLELFEAKWGFSRLAPDLEDVARRYAGTPLLWNQRWFGPAATGVAASPEKSAPAPAFEQSDWVRYTKDAATQARVNFRVGVVVGMLQQIGMPKRPVLVGVGDGLAAHLIASRGLNGLAIDDRPGHVELARRCTQQQKYPAAPGSTGLRLELWADVRRLPLPDGGADLIVLLDVLQRHPNPARLLREAHRALCPGGVLIITSPRGTEAQVLASASASPTAGQERRYILRQMVNQVTALRGFDFMSDPRADDPSHDLLLICRRREGEATAMPEVAEMERRHAAAVTSVG
ncbi:MAG: methyltransferase domain-containing protein [Planctomycetota bacterium]|nr:methyltransferase domain-containing protein [Planctomycetota bacterium]